MFKIVCIIIGFISIGLGAVGYFVPLLPSFPFILLSAYCFGKSSVRLQNWFFETRFYKNGLRSYINGEGITRKAKFKIIIMLTVMMGIAFYNMGDMQLAKYIMAVVWICHIIYFVFGIKTSK